METQQDLIDLQKRYDALFVASMNLVELVSYAEIVGAVSVNRQGIRTACDQLFDIKKEEERQKMVILNRKEPYKFRETPMNLEEMVRWGMISHRIYDRVAHLPFNEAKERIDKEFGYQTWSFGSDHIYQYIRERDIVLHKDFDNLNEWVGHCLKLAKGRMNPAAPTEVWHKYHAQLNREPATNIKLRGISYVPFRIKYNW